MRASVLLGQHCLVSGMFVPGVGLLCLVVSIMSAVVWSCCLFCACGPLSLCLTAAVTSCLLCTCMCTLLGPLFTLQKMGPINDATNKRPPHMYMCLCRATLSARVSCVCRGVWLGALAP